jgi:phytoene dehydrogenase-like protein
VPWKVWLKLGVKFQTNNIEKIIVENKTAVAIQVGERIDSDLVLSGADYHHTETLLEQERIQRNTGIVGFCTFVFIILCGFQ